MDNKEYVLKRNQIGQQLTNNSVLILFSNKEEGKEPDKNFLYLTGIKENNDILLICKENDKVNSVLLIQRYDEFKAKWVGKSLDEIEAKEISGVEKIDYVDRFEMHVTSYISRGFNLYFDIESTNINDEKLNDLQILIKNIKLKYPYATIKQGRNLLQSARTIKSNAEINKIKEAISITNKGIMAILDNMKSGLYEYQLESYFDQAIKYHGSTSYAFETIAASGKNSCCLHYSKNNCEISDGDLVLFDLGATSDYYCADISRTFPANGKFTPRQREIYDIVLRGQKLVFESIKPGLTTRDLNNILVDFYKVELKKIGLIKEDSEVSKYYYHGVSHHLGLDCHDLCDYTPLKPGSVITVEPGLYILEESIGIRIEDDALVTEDGCINLSAEIIKEIDEIEAYLSNKTK